MNASTNNILLTHENPQGVGVLFLLAIPKIPKKNPHPPWGVWQETPVSPPPWALLVTYRRRGDLFLLAIPKITKKNAHPPGGLARNPCTTHN